MQNKIFRFNLDVKEKEFKTDFNLVQLDNTSMLAIKLFDEGNKLETTKEDTAEIAIDKNDNTFCVLPCNLYDNIVNCTLDSNALASPGWTNCEVRILNEDKVLTSARFKIYIRENIVNNEKIKSTTEYKALDRLINQAESMQESLKKGESVIEDVNKIKENLTEIKESILNKSKEIDSNLAVADEKINLIKTYISKSETSIENLINNQDKIEELSKLLTELEKIKLTLEEINNSVNKATTQQVELEKSTENAKKEKISLDDSVENSKTQNLNLKNTITKAEMSESSLSTAAQKGLIQQSELEKTISNSLDKDKSLKETNEKAESLKTDLNLLSENISSKITDGNKLKSNLDASTSNAGNAKSNLDASVATAKNTNMTLQATDTEAKKTEALIKDLMSQLGKTEDEVKQIIASGDLSKYVTDPKLQEALKSYATKEDLSKIDVTSQLVDYAKKTEIPTKLSQLNNDKTFKTETEIQTMINNSTKLKKEVVTSLPSSGKEDIIYLLKNKNDNNFYTEYLWIGGKWEIIGDTKVDLTDYAKKTDLPTKLFQLEDDANHRIVTDEEKERWNKKYGKTEVNELIDQRVKEEARNPRPKIMTAVIDQTNSNPLTCITYEDDARFMEKGSAEWDNFFGTKLVLFKDGKEVRDLQDSELNSLKPEDGDVMVKFRRMGLNIKTVGDKVYVSMTDNPDDDNFKYYAHTRGVKRREAFYLGAYLGYEFGGKLRSIRNVMPTDNKAIGTFRSLAQSNGSGYEQFAFYQLVFVQAMYILKYGNLDSQTAIGEGLTDGSYTNTGSTNGKGKDFGSTDATKQMRFQYLEDFYGNKYQFIDGIGTANGSLWIGMDNFNDSRSDYKAYSSSNTSGYYVSSFGDTERGFIVKTSGGSSTTHYCDYSYFSPSSSYFPCFGGGCSLGPNAGVFYFYCDCSYSESDSTIGARLMYL